jgi:hypothetical protein
MKPWEEAATFNHRGDTSRYLQLKEGYEELLLAHRMGPVLPKALEEATTILKSRRISRAGIKEEGKQLPNLSS